MNPLVETASNYIQHSNFAALLLDALLKSIVVLTLAGGLCLGLRRASAATRHLIWFLAVASLPFLPLLSSMLPSWQRPLWSVSSSLVSGNQVSLALDLAPAAHPGFSHDQTSISDSKIATATYNAVQPGKTKRMAAHFNIRWLVFAFVAWCGGVLLALFSIAVGWLRLGKISRQAHVLHDAGWKLLLNEVCENLRLRRPVLLLRSADDVMPMTWGWLRPAVLLPAEADQWPVERRRVVLLHELAHVKRWDSLTQMATRIICAFYWFNPLVWLAARRMCVERERACDDLVLAGGSKASDYSEHLLEIARSFRRIPQVTAIAMARSPQLVKRVQAIMDANCNRQRLHPMACGFIAVIAIGLAAAVAANKSEQGTAVVTGADESNPLREQQIARLQAFSKAKEKQSRTLAAVAGEQFSPEYRRFFDAATRGDWRTVTNMYESFKKRHPQYDRKPGVAEDIRLRTSYWGPVLEICLAYDHVVNCEPKYTQMAVDDLINSVPQGSIYFGGTDPGRGLPTAFCKSHVEADPFFTLTQNALADGSYLEYLQRTYGDQRELLDPLIEARRADSELQGWVAELQKAEDVQAALSEQDSKLSHTNPDDRDYKAAEKVVDDLQQKIDDRVKGILAGLRVGSKQPAGNKTIYIPTSEDSQKCFSEYLADATQRLHNHQLKPGENVKEESNGPGNPPRTQVSGQIAVMSINALLAKIIFDKNPDHEFYIEESFPLDWMYPYLEPWGPIMKINRQPLTELSGEVLRQDHEYWRSRVAGMIGDWLTEATPVQAVTEFVEKVYVRHDLSGFRGDPRFVQNDYAKRLFSKWRSDIGGVYVWRVEHAAGESGRARVSGEADFAFKEAVALCPSSPEAVFRYVSFLLNQKRNSDALLIAETASHMEPENGQFNGLVNNVKQMPMPK